MGSKVKKLKNYTAEQVEALFESDENNKVGIKLYAILQLVRGCSSRKLTEFYRVSFDQICNWVDSFDAEGIEGLKIKPGHGAQSKLTDEQKYRLQGDLLKNPEEFGYNTADWSSPLLQEHIEKHYNVYYKIAAVYSLMKQPGFSFQHTKNSFSRKR